MKSIINLLKSDFKYLLIYIGHQNVGYLVTLPASESAAANLEVSHCLSGTWNSQHGVHSGKFIAYHVCID